MVQIEQSVCIGCGACVGDCPIGNLKVADGKAACSGPCFQCGHCVAICPAEAVSILDYEMSEVEAYDKERFAFDIDRLLYTIKCRRSIRHYAKQPVEREKLESIIQAGRYTATGVNRQACRFVMVQDGIPTLKNMIWNGIDAALENPGAISPEMLSALRNLADTRTQGTDFLFRDAPVVMYVAAESTVDAALAAQNMEMAAIAQGLGVLYNGYLVQATAMNPAACEWLGLQDKPIVVCMLAGCPKKLYMRSAPRRKADVIWR